LNNNISKRPPLPPPDTNHVQNQGKRTGDVARKWRYYLHKRGDISTKRSRNLAQTSNSGGSGDVGDGGDILRMIIVAVKGSGSAFSAFSQCRGIRQKNLQSVIDISLELPDFAWFVITK
jgi:hypothetical protein